MRSRAVRRAEAHYAEHGFCRWAVEAPGTAPLVGAVGLSWASLTASLTPVAEVAWRFNQRFWGHGYATEAARAAIHDGFTRIGLRQIVALTTPASMPSQRVMQRLGMTSDIEFDHPRYPLEHPLCRHVLYRLASPLSGSDASSPPRRTTP